MKAELKPRITLEGRTPLQNVIPLNTPFLLFIDPSNVCNQQCSFCPTGNHELVRKYRSSAIMSMATFIKVQSQIREFETPIKTVRMYKDGEPLLNKDLPMMIRYLKLSGKVGSIDTTTNGLLLDGEMSLNLIEAGLDRIFISVPHYYNDKYVRQVQTFYLHRNGCEVYVKIIGDGMTEDQKKKFMDDFGNISDRIFIENLAPCWPNFKTEAIMDKGIYGNELTNVDICPYVFYSMSVNSDGSVSCCFLDWGHELIVGSVYNGTLYGIWNGAHMNAYRKMMVEGHRKNHHFCKNCGQLTHCLPDNLDPYREQIKEKMNDGR